MRSVQAFVGALWICAIGILSAQSVLRKHYAAPGACGFTFDYPADWVASATGSTGDCRVRVRPLDFDDLKQDGGEDSYTLEVGREQGDFLEAASKNLFDTFDFSNLYGRLVWTNRKVIMHFGYVRFLL